MPFDMGGSVGPGSVQAESAEVLPLNPFHPSQTIGGTSGSNSKDLSSPKSYRAPYQDILDAQDTNGFFTDQVLNHVPNGALMKTKYKSYTFPKTNFKISTYLGAKWFYTCVAVTELLSGRYDDFTGELEMILRKAAGVLYTRNKTGDIVKREREKLVPLTRATVGLVAGEMGYDGYGIVERIKMLEA